MDSARRHACRLADAADDATRNAHGQDRPPAHVARAAVAASLGEPDPGHLDSTGWLTGGQAMRDCSAVAVPEAIERVALFPLADLPELPVGHPSRRVTIAGVMVELPAGLPMGDVFPEQVAPSDVERVVGEVQRFLRGEGREKAVWFVPEAASPGDLAERLRGLGMTPDDEPPGEPRAAALIAVEPPPPGPPELVARRVESLEELLAGQLIAADAFHLDEEMRRAFEQRAERLWPFMSAAGALATFVVSLDGRIIASGEAHFGETAVVLAGAGTRSDQRGRGAYRALVRARWDAAVARGTPVLTVSAGAMSRPILERLGFSVAGWIDCLVDDLSAEG